MDYPTKYAVLVRSPKGLPIKGKEGYLFRFIGTTDQYMYCNVSISSEEGWTCVSNPNEGYNYVLYLNDEMLDEIQQELQEDAMQCNDSDEGDDKTEQNDDNDSWDDSNTKFLLSLYKEYIQLVRNRKIKTKTKMWDRIQTDFHNKNINFSSKQIENRFKTLERRYKHLKNNNKMTGRGRQNFEYKKALDEIFENDPKIFPEMLMSAGTTIFKEDLRSKYNIGSSAGSANNSKENVPNHEIAPTISSSDYNKVESESAAPSKKVRRSVDILLELKNDLKEQFQQKETDREKKIKLIEERNIQLKRKNDLFEKYISLKFREQESP